MTRRLGISSAIAVVLLSAVYAITLAAGLLTLASSREPIGDPWFSLLEVEIIALAPLMVIVSAEVHAWAAPAHKTSSLIALVFMSLLAALTCSVHVVMLTVSHQAAAAELPLLLSFRWPSVPYAIDILAWDLFFGLSVLFAAPAFHGDRLRTRIRVLLTISGALALAGLIGVAPGAIQLRMIGVVGYAIVYPVAVALLAVLFRRGANAV